MKPVRFTSHVVEVIAGTPEDQRMTALAISLVVVLRGRRYE